ncbi:MULTISPECIES: aa3-type cytochrome c oxidase subunit IV [Halocynthiibacter]|uniref:Aa3-type cytochrome c oxidase subunit IV n=1 Tax=Halocynthiibacter halioticoli TaxID=2986804 RepID=A0AAE3LSB2_9RHOB|nr:MULTISPECIES: aa3-type cytochrome c oxidase subunit IV [Halocynthiibacter]MCV6823211.1 aa3-type cytochrome c oxidase subunit IV [Halocynthiibacter halioticoli]MCW4056212.1 aa3-type cytochrome c oxidase subunit IV [Halocynthiibacter sp. SDUM655004]MDE0590822.1 aa3-type cytochrome c oxidase subunit IV [Halocynthiibacter sp. C4]
MAEYKPGEMNIEVQEKTFNGFIKMVKWGTILCILILIFLAIFNT